MFIDRLSTAFYIGRYVLVILRSEERKRYKRMKLLNEAANTVLVSAHGNKQEQAMDISHLAVINKVRSRLRIKESTINFYLVKATSGSSTDKAYGNIWRILNNQCNII